MLIGSLAAERVKDAELWLDKRPFRPINLGKAQSGTCPARHRPRDRELSTRQLVACFRFGMVVRPPLFESKLNQYPVSGRLTVLVRNVRNQGENSS